MTTKTGFAQEHWGRMSTVVLSVLLVSSLCNPVFGQDGAAVFPDQTITSPQVVAGPGFNTLLTLLNAGAVCEIGVRYHVGAGQAPTATILTNGENLGNEFTQMVGPDLPVSLELTTTGETYEGAVTFSVPALCAGRVSIESEYRLFAGNAPAAGTTSSVTEVFSYGDNAPTDLERNTCALTAFYNFPNSDPMIGQGFVVVAEDRPVGAELEISAPGLMERLVTDGRHTTITIPELYEGQPVPEEGVLSVCVQNLVPPSATLTFMSLDFFVPAEGDIQFGPNPAVKTPFQCESGIHSICLNSCLEVTVVESATGLPPTNTMIRRVSAKESEIFVPDLGIVTFRYSPVLDTILIEYQGTEETPWPDDLRIAVRKPTADREAIFERGDFLNIFLGDGLGIWFSSITNPLQDPPN